MAPKVLKGPVHPSPLSKKNGEDDITREEMRRLEKRSPVPVMSDLPMSTKDDIDKHSSAKQRKESASCELMPLESEVLNHIFSSALGRRGLDRSSGIKPTPWIQSGDMHTSFNILTWVGTRTGRLNGEGKGLRRLWMLQTQNTIRDLIVDPKSSYNALYVSQPALVKLPPLFFASTIQE
ncbi:hypothetical protein D9757_007932 [Collybiopsis confluens]|uniref:Uncharacterized protein n=1 Tax=Collybiopsis confluens TaxID=2823264 RepID=A0A8H5M4E8_9AGAR|nr:hypothetical protein D9757_007932 [Collybiopsis confluens]